jgi:hypothetical protein
MVLAPNEDHRRLLYPLFCASKDKATQVNHESNLRKQLKIDGQESWDFLKRHGLVSMWRDSCESLFGRDFFSIQWQERLDKYYQMSVHLILEQDLVLAEFHDEMDKLGNAWLVFKGAAWRNTLYDRPTQRLSADIDILILPQDRASVIEKMQSRGFRLTIVPHLEEYQVQLHRGSVCIDLHTHPFRPYRSAIDITSDALATRKLEDGLWVMSPEWDAVMHLVHSPLSEHLTQSLFHIIDLRQALLKNPKSFRLAVPCLERMGLKTAGWSMLQWMSLWSGSTPDITHALEPRLWRREYIDYWLHHLDPALRYMSHPHAVRATFSLLLHDRPQDMSRVVKQFVLGQKKAIPKWR